MQDSTTVPRFPEWREIELADKPMFDAAFVARPPELSAYTFTNLFAWSRPNELRLSEIDGLLLVWRMNGGRIVCFEPLGDDPVAAIGSVLSKTGPDTEFTRIHAEPARRSGELPGIVVELDRDNSDYLYLASDLIDLPGRKFDAKRNFINRINAEREYEYLVMDQRVADECRQFADVWCDEKSCATIEDLRLELMAVHGMLANFDTLGIVGGAIRIDGTISAFSLGEALNPGTLVVHVEKADTRIDGLYQLINNEFCSHETRSFTYVNREQDLGVPGLRKAKKSYQPVRMVEAWKVTVAT